MRLEKKYMYIWFQERTVYASSQWKGWNELS